MRSWVVTVAMVSSLCWHAAWAPGGAVGWRTDGTGRYPQANPPLKWSPNGPFVWKTKLPNWSNGSPVITGEKIFVCAEPDLLICVDRTSGKILWQRANPLTDVLSEEQIREMEAAEKKVAEIKDQMSPLQREARRLKGYMKKGSGKEKYAKRHEEVAKQLKQLQKKLDSMAEHIKPKAHSTNGYTSSTPATDGRRVYAVFGTGVVVCYDMEGNRKWIKLVQKPTHEWGHSSSPVLVGDKLVVHVRDTFGMDATTGEQLWRAKSKPHWGSVLAGKVGEVDVAINSNGDIIRVADGAILAARVQPLDYNSPAVYDGVAYFIQHGGRAVRLPKSASDRIDPETLWRTNPPNDRYYGSPLIHDGLIYVVHRKNVFSVIDAANGEVVYSKKLALGKGTTYPSITLGGNHIFVSSDNGTTLVLEPGREYKQVAENKLEPFRSSPVFLGDRIYIRGLKHLYCIGN